MKHKHYDLIVAWANGAKIQVKPHGEVSWRDRSNPSWAEDCDYRIKPEPKPDVVLYGYITQERNNMEYVRILPINADTSRTSTDTCMFTFDGETGALKDAQVLAKV